MRVLYPYTARVPSAVTALSEHAPVYDEVDVSADERAYWRLLSAAWSTVDDLVIIEQDIVIHEDVFPQFEACSSLWCTFGYPRHRTPQLLTRSLGCVRFRGELIEAEPELMVMVGAVDFGAGKGHWSRLDDVIAELLRQAHHAVCTHLPPVGHVQLGSAP